MSLSSTFKLGGTLFTDPRRVVWRALDVARQLTRQEYSFLSDAIIIAVIPAILAVYNDAWLYPKIGHIDEWYYVGFGMNYLDPTFGTAFYKISRLPWVLTETIARHIFLPVTASWILILSSLAFGNIAFYSAMREVFGRFPAALAAVFLSAFTVSYASGGADYHNTLAGPLFCVAMLFAIRSARSAVPSLEAVIFGAATALAFHSNITFINFLPILCIHYAIAYYRIHHVVPPLIRTALLATVGAIGITVALGLVNVLAGRQFSFFMPIVEIVIRYVGNTDYEVSWWLPWRSGWFWSARYLGPYLVGLPAAAVCLAAAFRRARSDGLYLEAAGFSAAYLYAGILWIIWQSVGHVALQPAYFAYPLVFPFSGLVAAVVALVVQPSFPRLRSSATPIIAALAICLILELRYPEGVYSLGSALSSQGFLQSATGFSVAFLLLGFGRMIPILLLAAIPAFGAANVLSSRLAPTYASTRSEAGPRAYNFVIRVHEDLRSIKNALNCRYEHVFLFADAGETDPWGTPGLMLDQLSAAVVSTGFAYVAPPWDRKTLESVDLSRWREIARAHGVVGFMTRNPERRLALQRAIESAGIHSREVHVFSYVVGDSELKLYVVQAVEALANK